MLRKFCSLFCVAALSIAFVGCDQAANVADQAKEGVDAAASSAKDAADEVVPEAAKETVDGAVDAAGDAAKDGIDAVTGSGE